MNVPSAFPVKSPNIVSNTYTSVAENWSIFFKHKAQLCKVLMTRRRLQFHYEATTVIPEES